MIEVFIENGGSTIRLGENTEAASASAAAAAASAVTASGAAVAAAADAVSTAADRVQTGLDAASTAADAVATAADRVQTGVDRAATQGYAAAAQAISFATSIDAEGNLVIGTGAAAPGDTASTDGNCVILGTGSGVGSSQTYTRKLVALGAYTGLAFRGYTANLIGAYTGARAVAELGAFYGTHAGQDANVIGLTMPGFGARATGTVTFSGVPTAGDTVTVNGVAMTVAAVPATAYEFAPGTTAAEAARNLVRALVALSDAAILAGLYRRDSTTTGVVSIASAGRGTAGNAFTLAKSGVNIAVSGAVLSGGTDVSNSGATPSTYSGDVAVGYGALAYTQNSPGTRKAIIEATMGSNPADGAYFKLGFSLTKTVTFKTTPVGALDVQLGSTVSETLEALVATLNGAVDTTIDDVTYWAKNGQFFIEHDTANIHTFECRSYTSALVFPAPFLWGAASNAGPNTGLGYYALQGGFISASAAVGQNAGLLSSGVGHVIVGASSGTYGNGRNRVILGYNTGSDIEGDSVIVIGSEIAAGAQEGWLAITGVATDGTVTFAAPHGWREGHIFRCYYRDRVSSGATIQRAPTGTGTWTNMATTIGGTVLQAINATQAKLFLAIPEASAGGRVYDFRVNGTASNIDMARHNKVLPYSATIGDGATAVARQFTLGSARYTLGVKIDAMGLYVAAGELRLPPITVGGAWPTGYIQFATANGNFSADETVTLNGTVFTAKAAATFATPNTSMIRWFRIGADMYESLNNLIACIRNSDDQSAAAKLVNKGRFWAAAQSGSGWRLHFQGYSTAAYTLATSKAGATVSGPSASTISGVSISTSANPPQDKGLVMLSTSPAANGDPGMARYDLATDSWTLI